MLDFILMDWPSVVFQTKGVPPAGFFPFRDRPLWFLEAPHSSQAHLVVPYLLHHCQVLQACHRRRRLFLEP